MSQTARQESTRSANYTRWFEQTNIELRTLIRNRHKKTTKIRAENTCSCSKVRPTSIALTGTDCVYRPLNEIARKPKTNTRRNRLLNL